MKMASLLDLVESLLHSQRKLVSWNYLELFVWNMKGFFLALFLSLKGIVRKTFSEQFHFAGSRDGSFKKFIFVVALLHMCEDSVIVSSQLSIEIILINTFYVTIFLSCFIRKWKRRMCTFVVVLTAKRKRERLLRGLVISHFYAILTFITGVELSLWNFLISR